MKTDIPVIKIRRSFRTPTESASQYSRLSSWVASGILMPAALWLCWQVVATLHHGSGIGSQGGTAVQGRAIRQADQMAAEAANAHLFGLASGQRNPTHMDPASTDVTVDGILYADDSGGSLAMLSVDGQSVAAQVGTVLATNETVTRILPDQVELTSGQATRSIQLDIKGADTNQRTRFAALGADGQLTDAPAEGSGPRNGTVIMPLVVNATPTARATIVQPHFVPIGALRGREASQERFGKVKPP